MEERDFQYPISVLVLLKYCALASINWIFYMSYIHTVNIICAFVLRRYMSCVYFYMILSTIYVTP
jgi:hypothetical protein